MLKELEEIKSENEKLNAAIHLQRKTYSRIMTNEMTVVAHRLFKDDKEGQLWIILFRLKQDFGFSYWEIANFTGTPVAKIQKIMTKYKPIIDSKILNSLSKLDKENDQNKWLNMIVNKKHKQGYYTPGGRKKEKSPMTTRFREEAPVHLGGELVKDYVKT